MLCKLIWILEGLVTLITFMRSTGSGVASHVYLEDGCSTEDFVAATTLKSASPARLLGGEVTPEKVLAGEGILTEWTAVMMPGAGKMLT